MARLWTEGFEMGDNLFWTFVSGGSQGLVTAAGQFRSGVYAYYVDNGAGVYRLFSSALSELYLRIPCRINSSNGLADVIQFRNGATTLVKIGTNASNLIEIEVGATVVATGLTPLDFNDWYLLEIRYKLDNATGEVTVRLDGATEATFSGDTQPGADTTFDRLYIQHPGGGGNRHFFMDDLAANDISGVTNNSWPGQGFVVRLAPNGDGSSSQWVGSDGNSVNNSLLVDEVPPNADTDYVETTVATQTDLYAAADYTLPSGHSVLRAWVETRAKDQAAAGGQMQLGVKSGATESWSASRTLTGSYDQVKGNDLTTDPNTALAWTESALDAIEMGIRTP